MGSPARQKRLGLSFFAPKFFTISLPFKWVYRPEWICDLPKILASGLAFLSGLAFFDEIGLSVLANLPFLK